MTAHFFQVSNDPTPDEVWDKFWAFLVTNDGEIDMEKLKNELFDFYQVLGYVPRVYDHVTGGRVSKILTKPEVVCALADEHYREN